MAKNHLYLPKLAGANVAEPKQHGHWESQDKSIISSISDGIEVDREAHTRGVSSIPDAYARPLTFQSALGSLPDKPHPLRDLVVQEWRGMLSLLALRGVKPDLQGLRFVPVEMKKRTDSGPLAEALRKLAPRGVRLQRLPAPEYEWTDFLLVQFAGVTLGAFSPTTLVYTSADYNLHLRDKGFTSSLRDADGYLMPPRATSNREDLVAVGEWVQWFAKEFAALANTEQVAGRSEHTITNTINGELRAWLTDIKRELNLRDNEQLDAPEYEPSDEPERVADASFLEPREIYRLLLRPLRPDRNQAVSVRSDYALDVSAGRLPTGVEHVVVIDAGLLGQNLYLWTGTPANDLGPDPIRTHFLQASGTQIKGINIGKDGGLWIRPELFFLTPTLTKASGPGNFLPGAESVANGSNSRYLLPLRKEILQFFTVEDIIERLKPQYTEENERVVFRLQLPLKNGRSLELKKSYLIKSAAPGLGEGDLKERAVPVLELFPNYMGEFWARYYLLFSDTERLAAEPVHYGTSHFYTARREQRLDTNTERLRAELTRISGVDCFPEGIALSERNSKEAIGLVLLTKDRNIESSSFRGKAVVGVDFGTSNTNVFTLRDDEAKPLTFTFTKYLRSLLAAEPEMRRAFAQNFFVPSEDITLPTPTALREYNPGVRKDLLLDYFLYFPDRPRYPENVLVDLKWEEDDTVNLNNYLEALVFLILVDLVRERVGTIEFRCTYPKSFNKAREQDYRSKWSSTLANLFEREGRPEALRAGQHLLYAPAENWDQEQNHAVMVLVTARGEKLRIMREPRFVTEGIAAGEFFSSENRSIGIKSDDRASRTSGSICIDVGGGTTDYSIWFDRKIQYDASVLLAGKQIAEVMARNSRIGDQLLSPDAQAALREARGPRFASRMNYILRREHKEISANLARVSNVRDIVNLRRVLVVEFGALAFYAGHLALALDRFLGGGFGRSVVDRGLSLHWGGNASKMLDWIDHGQYKPDGLAAQFLNNLFACVVRGKVAPEPERMLIPYDKLRQKQSPGQKNEAAGGAVVMEREAIDRALHTTTAAVDEFVFDEPDAPTTLEGTVMGEAIDLGAGLLPPYQPLKASDLFRDYSTFYRDTPDKDNKEKSQLTYFLQVLNAVGAKSGFLPAGEQITLSDQELLSIRNNLRDDFAALAAKDPSRRVIEPVFIMEVRYLLAMMLERML